MSQQANITVFDGASTPVTHTFIPEGAVVRGNVETAAWKENLTTVPDYALTRIATTKEKTSSGVWIVGITVSVPVMESVSGQNAAGYTAAPKVAYTNKYRFTGYFHERATTAEKRLGRMLLVNFMNNVSTSVAAATGGFASELVDSLVSAS